jgi:hypothetical protein
MKGFAAVVVLVAVVAVSLPGPVSASSAGRKRCERARQPVSRRSDGRRERIPLHTVIETRRVWIATEQPGEREEGTSYFSCWKPTGRSRFLGYNTGGASLAYRSLGDFRVRGRYVAFRIEGGGGEEDVAPYARFRSFDVRTGRLRRDSGHLEGRYAPDTGPALTTTGAIAWIHTGTLYAADASEPAGRTLAGPEGGPISELGARGRTVIWVQGGTQHTAELD